MLSNGKEKIVVVGGPTCTGKSEAAVRLCQTVGGEIVNADAMQVYRHFDIGTAKPDRAMREAVPHHVIDIIEPDGLFNASLYVERADDAVRDILSRRKVPVIVGGTGLYIRALLFGLTEAKGDEGVRRRIKEEYVRDPLAVYDRLVMIDRDYAARISFKDAIRVVRALEVFEVTGSTMSRLAALHGFKEKRYDAFCVALNISRDELYRRIDMRVDVMLSEAWVNEVAVLLEKGFSSELKPFQSIGYKDIVLYIRRMIGYEQMVGEIKKKTRRYAKRQFTWFKNDANFTWYDYPGQYDRIVTDVSGFLV